MRIRLNQQIRSYNDYANFRVYAVWGALQQMVYRRISFTTVDQLKETIVTEWTKLSQRFIGAQLINGVVGFNALSSSKEDTLNILCNEIHPCNVTVKIIAVFL